MGAPVKTSSKCLSTYFEASVRCYPPPPLLLPLLEGFYFIQGFRDSSLSVWEASCVLRNFELRTGQTVSREDLDNGILEGQFMDEGYALKDSVSLFLSYLLTIPSPYFVFNSSEP